MPVPAPKHLYAYRLEPWEFTKAALADLVQAKNAVLAKQLPNTEKMYRYIDALAGIAGNTGTDDVSVAIDHETLRFLDTGLAWAWLRTPDDPAVYNDLTVQLMMLSAATGVYDTETPPYTLEEMAEIGDGRGDGYYHDMTYIRTLRYALGGEGGEEYGHLLFATLPQFEEREDVARTFSWDDALVFSLLLQTVWRSFPFLDANEQKFLLQNYFYMGIAAGVPTRVWIKEMFDTRVPGVNYRELSSFFFQAIAKSMESVPFDTEDDEGESLADIMKDFFAAVYNEEITTLAQEKFISGLYKDQPESDYFAAWMREALSICLSLRNGAWMR